jgi:hypothetical protein
MRIKRLRGDSPAREYIRTKVSAGYSAVAISVAEKFDFARGSLFAILPETADGDQLLDFQSDIEDVVDRNSALRLLGQTICGFVAANPTDIVVIQDFWHKTSQPLWRDYEHKELAVFYGDEIYWKLAGSHLAPELAAYVAEGASFWPFEAFFYLSATLKDDDHLIDADIEELATNVVAIAVDAFDAESFVILWREDIRPFPLVV